MYAAFYELSQEPFHVTPDPEFLFPSPAHKEALAAIVYGIEQRKGFVAISGEVGVGKTTILRSYLDLADRKNLKLIYIYNSNLTFDELLTTIFRELGIEDRPETMFLAVTRLHEELIEIYRKNQTVVLIIDEAQNMPAETLESLRMLSNLETVTEKLIQIILIGQPEFEEMLQQHRLRQLRNRIAIHARIGPLSIDESIAYLEHRIKKVALTTKPVFSKQALHMIARAAKGIPRTLNILADNALVTGYGYQVRPVGTKVVREVLADRQIADAEPVRRRLVPSAWIGGALAVALAVVAAALIGTWVFGNALVSSGTGNALAAVREEVDRWLGLGPDDRQIPRTGSEANSELASAEPRHVAPPPPVNDAAPLNDVAPRTSSAQDAERRPTAPVAADNASPRLGTTADVPAGTALRSSPHVVLPEQLARAPAMPDRSDEAAPDEPARPAEILPPRTAPILSQPHGGQSDAAEHAENKTDQEESGSGISPARPEPEAGGTTLAPVREPAQGHTPPTASEPRTTPQLAARPPPASTPAQPPAEVTPPAPVTPPVPPRSIAALPVTPPRAIPSRPDQPDNDAGDQNPRNRSAGVPRPRDEHIVRVVRFGDNLWTMAEDVYGYVNPNVLRKVQDANPQIRNINWLNPGQEILFPRSPEELPDRTVEILNLNQTPIRSDGR